MTFPLKPKLKRFALKRFALPDGREIFCLHRDEIRGVQAQAQGYFRDGFEISPGDVVVDAGANIGLFSLEAARRGATVHAFEPMPATFSALSANALTWGNGEIHVYNLALGQKSERANFIYFPFLSALSTRFPRDVKANTRRAIEAVFDNSALTPRAHFLRRLPRPLRRAFFRFLASLLCVTQRVNCHVEPLSTQLETQGITRVDWLKIDVEGAEMQVLEGISPSDWPKIERIVAEVHDEQGRLTAMKKLLAKQGFSFIHTEKEPDAGEFGIYLLWARR